MLRFFTQSRVIQTTFLVSLVVSIITIYSSERFDYQQSRLTTKNIASSYVSLIKNNLSQAISATYPIAAFIRKQGGNSEGFVGLATEMLDFYPGVASLQLQPDGIISDIVPLKGNEKALGHNVLIDPERNVEAILARDSGKLTLAGPFDLVQGGKGAAARLPVYIETSHGETFWGFTTALIRFPDVLASSNLKSLEDAGYAYSLYRVYKNTSEIDIFAESTSPLINDPELFPIDVPNAQWIFSVTPIDAWTPSFPLFIKGLLGLFFTLLLTFLSFLMVRLKQDHLELENTIVERTKALESLAHYDELTKLPNRTLFADRFNQAIAQSKRNQTMLAVCFLDLDDFKEVNDTFGHDEGDKLLVSVAKRLKTIIRADDTVSRQGGDEFILLLKDINSVQQLELTLERIHRAMIKPHLVGGRTYNSNLSFGATLYRNDNADLDTLIRHADHAMYQAKLTGKNRYHLFDSQDNEIITQKHHDIQEIHKAFLNNEFQLYYQPKVNMKTGDVFGTEALIRWIHPENGMIPPLDFLPLIKDTDLEIQVGSWVINQAIKQLNLWSKQALELEISVNISSHHLQSPHFITHLKTALTHYPKVQANHLQLEILESSALGDISAIRSIIKQCQNELGVNVALDDFGTGYSSLTHLRSLPANTIKIDQSFVRDLLDDPNDFSIIDGIISLAEAFNRDIIAEGVETTDHGIMLLTMGCELAQGYGISRPIPPEEFTVWLDEYSPNETWLAFGQTQYSKQQQKIILIKITTGYWFRQFYEQIQLSDASLEADLKLCHLGTWLNRLEQDNTFDAEWFSSLRTLHDDLFNYAKLLCEQIDTGITDQNRVEINNRYQSLINLLDDYESDSLFSLVKTNTQ